MDHILSEIDKIQGERQADERIKKVLKDMADILNNVMINAFPADEAQSEKPTAVILNDKAVAKVEVEDDDSVKDETQQHS
jgi:hypothetical protein